SLFLLLNKQRLNCRKLLLSCINYHRRSEFTEKISHRRLPCVLGYNVWSNLHLIGGRDVLDSEDFIVSNLLLPIGSLIYLLFCVTKWGWGFDNYLEEANTGKGIKIARRLKPYFQFILPILILFILIQGLL
ncbi:hypothetical protein ACTQ1U_14495, partial [Thermoguttaceae bacterium LCP21S3_D4]